MKKVSMPLEEYQNDLDKAARRARKQAIDEVIKMFAERNVVTLDDLELPEYLFDKAKAVFDVLQPGAIETYQFGKAELI